MREAAFEIARQSDDFAPSIAHEFAHVVARSISHIGQSLKAARLHRTLGNLDNRMLNDIGISRADIDQMAAHAGSSKTVGTFGWQCSAR